MKLTSAGRKMGRPVKRGGCVKGARGRRGNPFYSWLSEVGLRLARLRRECALKVKFVSRGKRWQLACIVARWGSVEAHRCSRCSQHGALASRFPIGAAW